ncbi:uncharacterized protein LOC108115189 isoform X2 [Drosophila eugracilis]|uniref:uncharacterized protein LOC108115189 isoform X2 n=1 Tax=Drosophila eugracilis TaxID=29029 RepID=UPI001BDB340D|nr:uncharacterized protein LOC108115189 isoform X2 [Drosophila eugracilis]
MDDLPAIDILTFITEELLQTYRSRSGEDDRVRAITEFLQRWNKDFSIAKLKTIHIEFDSDLDWFNVTIYSTIQ